MTLFSPSENFEIEYLLGVARISTPGRKNPRQMLLLGFWLVYWLLVLIFFLFAGHLMVGVFQAGKGNTALLIFSVFAGFAVPLFWGIHGSIAAYVLFWQIAGLETLEIGHNSLKVRKTIFGIGKTREYKRDKIVSVELSSVITRHLAFTKFEFTSFNVAVTGPVLVRLEGRKGEYLGLGLEPQEAEKIVAVIQKQLFPSQP